VADDHYVAQTDRPAFAPEGTSEVTTIPVNGRPNGKPDGTLFVKPSDAINAFFADNQAFVTIVNDDKPHGKH
jgi:hypothetical protein